MARAESMYGVCTDMARAAEEISQHTANVQGQKVCPQINFQILTMHHTAQVALHKSGKVSIWLHLFIRLNIY